MDVILKGFGQVMRDNDRTYIDTIQKKIEEIDEWAGAEIVKTPIELQFRICLSDASKFEKALQNINNFHNLFGIKVNFSKSMKKISTIQYTIDI